MPCAHPQTLRFADHRAARCARQRGRARAECSPHQCPQRRRIRAWLEPESAMSDGDGEVATKRRRLTHSGEADVVMFAILGGVALIGYHDLFGGWANYAGPTFGGVAAGAIFASLLRPRLTIGRAFVIALVAGALFVIYSALVGTLVGGVFPGLDTIRALRDGVAHGFSDALGDSLPLRDRQGPLVLVSALSWLCGYTTTDISLRSRLAAVPLIPPIVPLGLSLPLTAPIGGPSVVYISIFVALCFLAVLLRASPDLTANRSERVVEIDSRSLVSSRLTVGVPLVAIIALLCPLVANAASSNNPFD